jgi:hypothetical protein
LVDLSCTFAGIKAFSNTRQSVGGIHPDIAKSDLCRETETSNLIEVFRSMINVFLDDERPCPKNFRLARSVKECIRLLKTKKVKILSLDYDLGFGQPNGMELVQYMVAHNLYARKIIIHSANPFGRFRMYSLLNKNKPKEVSINISPKPIYIRF